MVPFPAGDGKTVMLGLQNEREWISFCKHVLRQPQLATDERFASNARRTANRALRSVIIEAFAGLTAEQVIARLDDAGIANAQMNDMHDVWQHPQLTARNAGSRYETPVGAIPALLPPGEVDGFTPRMDPVPALGEHTDAILAELGWSSAEVAALRSAGAV